MGTVCLAAVELYVGKSSISRMHSAKSATLPVAVQTKLVRITNVDNLG